MTDEKDDALYDQDGARVMDLRKGFELASYLPTVDNFEIVKSEQDEVSSTEIAMGFMADELASLMLLADQDENLQRETDEGWVQVENNTATRAYDNLENGVVQRASLAQFEDLQGYDLDVDPQIPEHHSGQIVIYEDANIDEGGTPSYERAETALDEPDTVGFGYKEEGKGMGDRLRNLLS